MRDATTVPPWTTFELELKNNTHIAGKRVKLALAELDCLAACSGRCRMDILENFNESHWIFDLFAQF